ncbi:MAG TPA: AAA family ATPase, partial [Anaerolineaceae bacterium]|nr:AAA family ATPase [Anaerolineaceae bacterium]
MNEIIWKSRWSKEQIQSILIEQSNTFWQRDPGIQREKLIDVQKASALPHAVIISGLRRVGKSTLLAQLAHKLGKEVFYYLNFEDD